MNQKEIIEEWRKDPSWINVPVEVVERAPSGISCCDCGQDVNLYSESETYEYGEDFVTGEEWYLCEECLGKFREGLD